MRFELIDRAKKDFPVQRLCQVLGGCCQLGGRAGLVTVLCHAPKPKPLPRLVVSRVVV